MSARCLFIDLASGVFLFSSSTLLSIGCTFSNEVQSTGWEYSKAYKEFAMKKIVAVFLVVLVLSVLLVPMVSAQSPAAHSAQIVAQDEQPPVNDGDVTLPTDLTDLLRIVVGLLVAQGLKSISKLVGKDISGWSAVITASLASSVIFFFNALLSAVPEPARASVAVSLTLLVTILASFGLKDTLKSFQGKAVSAK